ncbi:MULTISPECIES: hypothetical protein [unclassified Burkholderia]|uniref:hypothetical protein n=1 Tax=unclassified Burkholderia TaxID=2613784 RepID=UPI000F59B0D5|nr:MULTISPECIES: hypothetical protein [unclassified Burkholderia]
MSEQNEDSKATKILVELIRSGSLKLPSPDRIGDEADAEALGKIAATYLRAIHSGLKAID